MVSRYFINLMALTILFGLSVFENEYSLSEGECFKNKWIVRLGLS